MKKASKEDLSDINIIKESQPKSGEKHIPLEGLARPTAAFTQALAREIVKNLTNIGNITTRHFRRGKKEKKAPKGEYPLLLDTSILIDGRILAIANSGFLVGTMLIPKFVLREVQYIADSADSIRRAKGRRGLEVATKLTGIKNSLIKARVIDEEVETEKEVDQKLVTLAKKWKIRLVTVDFNLAHLARARGVKVVSVMDLAQALKIAIVPGEEMTVKITHEGKEREQGISYLPDGTMIVVDNAKEKIGSDVVIVVTKIHQTPAGQLFFARLKDL